jgi:hypothetical protein
LISSPQDSAADSANDSAGFSVFDQANQAAYERMNSAETDDAVAGAGGNKPKKKRKKQRENVKMEDFCTLVSDHDGSLSPRENNSRGVNGVNVANVIVNGSPGSSSPDSSPDGKLRAAETKELLKKKQIACKQPFLNSGTVTLQDRTNTATSISRRSPKQSPGGSLSAICSNLTDQNLNFSDPEALETFTNAYSDISGYQKHGTRETSLLNQPLVRQRTGSYGPVLAQGGGNISPRAGLGSSAFDLSGNISGTNLGRTCDSIKKLAAAVEEQQQDLRLNNPFAHDSHANAGIGSYQSIGIGRKPLDKIRVPEGNGTAGNILSPRSRKRANSRGNVGGSSSLGQLVGGVSTSSAGGLSGISAGLGSKGSKSVLLRNGENPLASAGISAVAGAPGGTGYVGAILVNVLPQPESKFHASALNHRYGGKINSKEKSLGIKLQQFSG